MADTTVFPRYIFLWRHNGDNRWEAVPKSQVTSFLQKLIEDDGVNPATVMVGSDVSALKWLWPEFHRGDREISMRRFYEEISGSSEPYTPIVDAKPIPEEPNTLFGFISPDGRYFHCEYGGHMALARKIVGKLEKIQDPHRYLENHGWLVIFHDPTSRERYCVGTGFGKKITDNQLRAMERIGLPINTRGVLELL